MSRQLFSMPNAHNQMISVYEISNYDDVAYHIMVNDWLYAEMLTEDAAFHCARSLLSQYVTIEGSL